MKLDRKELFEVSLLFEKNKSILLSEIELEIINDSLLKNYNLTCLEQIILNALSKGIYDTKSERTSAYWALSKRIENISSSFFKNWLTIELKHNNAIAVFILLDIIDNKTKKYSLS
jgi:hypothetical protein